MKRITNYFLLILVIGTVLTACKKEDDPTPNPPTPSPFGTMTDSRDGNQYATVKIGNQTWMAENLRYLPQVHQQDEFVGAFTEPRYFVYGYDGNNVVAAKQHPNFASLGVLYNWAAVLQGTATSTTNPSGVKGICPSGWHVPSVAEWNQLVSYLISSGYNNDGSTEGNKLAKSVASKNLWNPSSVVGSPGNNSTQNNASGLNLVPAGRNGWPDFNALGDRASFWTSEHYGDVYAPSIHLEYNVQHFPLDVGSDNKVGAYSCRCVKD